MLILSNALSDNADEGCVKVACNLVKRLKQNPDNFVVSYERQSSLSNRHLKLNKLFLNVSLFREVRRRAQKVMYFPFPARALAIAVRVFMLSLFSSHGVEVLIAMQTEFDWLSAFLLKISRAHFTVLSQDTFGLFEKTVGEKRVRRIKTGVDTSRFVPVTKSESRELKIKYGFDPDLPLVMHAGHLNKGRNVAELLKLKDLQTLLVTSTLTKSEQDTELRCRLEEGGVRIIDEYVPNIEELYGACDVYFFPVEEYGRCIDTPLSCLEAAACNKPIVTTRYGEMREFEGKQGFCFIDSFDEVLSLVKKALALGEVSTRDAVLEYDFEKSISFFE